MLCSIYRSKWWSSYENVLESTDSDIPFRTTNCERSLFWVKVVFFRKKRLVNILKTDSVQVWSWHKSKKVINSSKNFTILQTVATEWLFFFRTNSISRVLLLLPVYLLACWSFKKNLTVTISQPTIIMVFSFLEFWVLGLLMCIFLLQVQLD